MKTDNDAIASYLPNYKSFCNIPLLCQPIMYKNQKT